MCEKKKNDQKIGASGLLDSAADVLFTDSLFIHNARLLWRKPQGVTLGTQEILLSPMWREPSWSWFQLTEGVGVWVKRVILKLDYDQERIKGLWHDYKTAISQATQHHSVSCPVMARDKARQTPVQVSLPRLQQATQTTIITPRSRSALFSCHTAQ